MMNGVRKFSVFSFPTPISPLVAKTQPAGVSATSGTIDFGRGVSAAEIDFVGAILSLVHSRYAMR